MTGAQFEIRIDGAPRTYRDRKDYAIEAARLLKSTIPHSMVEVKDLQSGDVTAVAPQASISDGPQAPPDRPRLRDRQDRPDDTVELWRVNSPFRLLQAAA